MLSLIVLASLVLQQPTSMPSHPGVAKPPAGKPAPDSPGAAVIRSAEAMYHGKWFGNVFDVRRVESENPTGVRVETWYEVQQPPGFARIDVAPAMTGREILYRNDSTYEFGRGTLRSATLGGMLPLDLLLYGMHSAPPEKTLAILARYGFDVRRMHIQVWDGEPVVVLGALAGDTVSNQIWLEKRRLLLVRLIERNSSDFQRPLDAHVTKYVKAGGGWLPGRVQFYLGGVLTQVDDYTNVHVDGPIEPHLFDPLPYHIPGWVQGMKDIFGGLPSTIPKGAHP